MGLGQLNSIELVVRNPTVSIMLVSHYFLCGQDNLTPLIWY